MAVSSAARQAAGRGAAVAGTVAAGTVAAAAGRPLRRIRVSTRSTGG